MPPYLYVLVWGGFEMQLGNKSRFFHILYTVCEQFPFTGNSKFLGTNLRFFHDFGMPLVPFLCFFLWDKHNFWQEGFYQIAWPNF